MQTISYMHDILAPLSLPLLPDFSGDSEFKQKETNEREEEREGDRERQRIFDPKTRAGSLCTVGAPVL